MKRRKLLIIGLDGVPFELIANYCDSGVMPNLKKLLQRGKIVPMTVTLPEISSVSWSSFMTGENPGTHGIFGFIDLNPGAYSFKYPDFSDLQCPTVFDRLGSRGKRSVVVNLPATYPARHFPGILISGFVAIHLQKSVYPEFYFPLLKRLGYQVDVDLNKGRDQKAEFLADLRCCLQIKKEAADYFWKHEEWDLFMFVVTETDRLHHFLFDAWKNPQNPFHEDFSQLYRDIDQVIGDFFDKAACFPDCEIIVLSDHGFYPVKREVYLNPILRQNGYFSSATESIKSLEGIRADARAFALDPSRIYIHLKEKYPRGCVPSSDYHRVRSEVKKLLAGFRLDGELPIQRIYDKEEVYSGDCLDQAADLILVPSPGFDLKAGLERKETSGINHFTGMHGHDNAFFFLHRVLLYSNSYDNSFGPRSDRVLYSVKTTFYFSFSNNLSPIGGPPG